MYKSLVLTLFILFSVSNTIVVLADEVKNNVPNVVVKELICTFSENYVGTLVNRSNKKVTGVLSFYPYDKDGDPIGDCGTSISLRPKRGTGIQAFFCNCEKATSVSSLIE